MTMSQPTRVLLVEDDDDHAEIVELHLRSSHKLNWLRVETLAEARDILARGDCGIALVDLTLPDSPLQETLAHLPALTAFSPIIVLTSLDDPEVGELAVKHGAEDYLSKGHLTGRRLVDAIRHALGRHQLKTELQAAHQEAQNSAAAKAEFLATMSHEIRTPMNAVIGFTHLLLETSLSQEQRLFLQTIQNSGESLLVIINDILDFSKIEAGKLSIEHIALKPREAVSDVVNLMTPRAQEKQLSLTVKVSPSLPPAVLGDPSRIRQVLLNLVGNAIKFTDRGGVRIDVGVQYLPKPKWIIEVHDSGVGIPAERLDAIFEKFTQVDGSTARKFGGTGLGLAITHRLVGLMKGKIEVESVLGTGSVFRVTLPFEQGAVTELPPADDSPEEALAKLQGVRVLVAEDTPTNQLLIRKYLEKLGCVVDIVGNGIEALENLDNLSYDMVLMDCHMPDMDGYEAVRAIRAREARGEQSRIPVVALTAGAMAEDKAASFDAGMDDHLSKPVRVAQLRQVLARWTAAP